MSLVDYLVGGFVSFCLNPDELIPFWYYFIHNADIILHDKTQLMKKLELTQDTIQGMHQAFHIICKPLEPQKEFLFSTQKFQINENAKSMQWVGDQYIVI